MSTNHYLYSMTSQKHLFDIPADIHYLNGAYMSPLMKSVSESGLEGMTRKLHPWAIHSEDFFTQAEAVKEKFGLLVNSPAQQIAIIPSASYGLKSAVNNIPVNTGNHVVVVSNDFPSDYYTIQAWCQKNKKEMRVIDAPDILDGRGAAWTENIINAISTDTNAIILSTIHWTDGTKFNLKEIGKKCKATNTLFIADGTQSVGAMPIDVMDFHLDALVCAAYKWLMGPYSIGVAYYSDAFSNGTPIEDSWMNRSNANDFTKLTRYVDDYKPGAARYNVGEFSNPILLSMLDRSLQQLHDWKIDAIQNYCSQLIQPLLLYLKENGYWYEQDQFRANHLFGFLLPASIDKDLLLLALRKNKVFVSVRGDGIRVSPHVYNDESNITALINTLKQQR
jgi:selenocysteine lyase/cysteine desulfurase